MTAADETVVLVTREGMGHGEAGLQLELFRKYVRLLLDNGTVPGAICFYTEGVRLVVDGSPALEELQALEKRGVHLIVCQTCLNHYGLASSVRVGIVGGMGDILAAQLKSGKVVSI